MKKWILKAIVQKLIAYLPFPQRINFFFQKYITRNIELTDDYFEDKLLHARNHISSYSSFNKDSVPEKTLELGSGWYPVVPICLYLTGAKDIRTIDISPLLNKRNVLITLKKFIEYRNNKKLDNYLSIPEERLDILKKILAGSDRLSLSSILNELNITYLLQDARKISLPPASVDLIHSNNTFEHIAPAVLRDILKEFKRIIKPGGVLSHAIDMSDHFAHIDKSITIYNFLRFSASQWKLIDNHIQPQNRLRITDYRTMYEQSGIPISHEDCRAGDVNSLRTIQLAARFRHIQEEQLAISHCHLVSAM